MILVLLVRPSGLFGKKQHERPSDMHDGLICGLGTRPAGCAAGVVRILFLHIAIQAVIWALFAASWDLLSGYTGQVSFGHAGFFRSAPTPRPVSPGGRYCRRGSAWAAALFSAAWSDFASAFPHSACAATTSRS